MTYIYKRGILLMLIITICFSSYTKAQTADADSTSGKQVQIRNIAFGTQPAWMVTGAVSTISGNELQKSFTTNLGNTLNGRLPDLTVRPGSGEAGYDSPTLNSRGLSTFGSGRSLYIVLDGIGLPTAATGQQAIEDLTPYEIESITLLKDAAATAVYGNRGANGVLLVTTKRGGISGLKINFNAQTGFQSAMRLPDFLGSYDYARLYNEGLVNDGNPAMYSAVDLEAYRTGSDPLFHPDVNWYDQVLRKSTPISNYDLNFSGGDKTVRYFGLLNYATSGGLYKKAGDLSDIAKNPTYSRLNFRANIDIQLSKRLSAAVLLGGSVEDKALPGVDINTNNLFDRMAAIPPNAFPVYVPGNNFGGTSLLTNPLGDILKTGYASSNGRATQTTFKMTEQLDAITKGLSITGAISFNTYFRTYSTKTRTYARFTPSQNVNGDTILTVIGANTSLAGNEGSQDQWRNYAIQGFLNYNRTFGSHKIDAMVMTNSDRYIVTGGDLPYKNIGIGGRFTYTNSDKYIGEFSFGYNGTENFPKGKRSGFFPAGSIGWIASNEDFLKGNDVLNYLKIRGSYGLTGNANIGGLRFMFDQYYTGTGSYYFGSTQNSVSTQAQGSLVNSNVTWEKQKQLNFGIEATMFQRLDVALDIFNQDRYDILALPNIDVPQYLGITLPNLNVGKVNNKGFEATVRYNSNLAKSLQFFVEANAWYAKNRIDYNSEALQVNKYLYRTGQSIDQPFGLQAIGFFKDQPDIDASPRQIFAPVQPGDIKYKDQNNDKIINQDDFYPIGNTELPQLTLGLHMGAKYIGFDLDAMFQGIAYHTVYLSGNYFQAFQNNAKISSWALNRWTTETAATADYPRLSASNNLNNYQTSSFWQRDGSFIKLRSFELGYTLPVTVTKKIGLDNTRVFINGTNLFSLDHMKGFTDPENLTGYPTLRVISLGLSIQL